MNITMINNPESAKKAYFDALHKFPLSESLHSLRAFFNSFPSDNRHKLAALDIINKIESTPRGNSFAYGMLNNATDKFLLDYFEW